MNLKNGVRRFSLSDSAGYARRVSLFIFLTLGLQAVPLHAMDLLLDMKSVPYAGESESIVPEYNFSDFNMDIDEQTIDTTLEKIYAEQNDDIQRKKIEEQALQEIVTPKTPEWLEKVIQQEQEKKSNQNKQIVVYNPNNPIVKYAPEEIIFSSDDTADRPNNKNVSTSMIFLPTVASWTLSGLQKLNNWMGQPYQRLFGEQKTAHTDQPKIQDYAESQSLNNNNDMGDDVSGGSDKDYFSAEDEDIILEEYQSEKIDVNKNNDRDPFDFDDEEESPLLRKNSSQNRPNLNENNNGAEIQNSSNQAAVPTNNDNQNGVPNIPHANNNNNVPDRADQNLNHADQNTNSSIVPTAPSTSLGKWLGIGAGIAAIGMMVWRLMKHIKPAFDGTLDKDLVNASLEIESQGFILEQINQGITLCDELIKRATEAQHHANDLQFVKAIWNRAKQLDTVAYFRRSDVNMVEAFIAHNDMQGLITYLADTAKPVLQQMQEQVTHNFTQAQKSKSDAQKKRDESSVISLATQGLGTDINKVAGLMGMGPLFGTNETPDELDSLNTQKKSRIQFNLRESKPIHFSQNVSYVQAYQYLGGLAHIDQEAKKAIKQNQSKHANGWFVTDMLASKKCAALQDQLSQAELNQLKRQIGFFELAFAIPQQTKRAVAIGQAYSNLKQCLVQLRNSAYGKQAQQTVIACDMSNKSKGSKIIKDKVEHKKESIEKQKKKLPQFKYQPKQEENLEIDDQEISGLNGQQPSSFAEMPQIGVMQIFGPAMSWVKDNPLLALGLAAATIYGVWSEVKGSGAPAQE